MAASTQLRDVGPISFVPFIQMGERGVPSMAVRTVRRIGILLDISFSVIALKVIFSDLGMTIGAVHSSCGFARPMSLRIDIRVALDTGNIPVNGVLYVFFTNGHGNGLSLDCFYYILFLVTFEAFTVRCAEDKACPSNRMGSVTISAGRNGSRLLFPQFSFDDFHMHFFDTGVALCAGGGYIAHRHCRLHIRMGKNKVIAVTVVACGCHDQSLLEQSFAMNTLGVVG
jgi:hypothetical protein